MSRSINRRELESRTGQCSTCAATHALSLSAKWLVVGLLLFSPFISNAWADASTNPIVFRSQTFVRTRGNPNTYTATFKVPSWVVGPYNLHLVNGDPDGRERASSASVSLNGIQVISPSDLNQNISTVDKAVSPANGSNTLQVTMEGKPGSEITLTIWGINSDKQPPAVTIVTPADGSYINTATPRIEITYSKQQGPRGDDHADCDETTLKISIDGVDRTKLFTIRKGDATATIPTNLALSAGVHTIVAALYDEARNLGSATSTFTVQLAVPTIKIVQPALGVYLNTTTPTIAIQYSDSVGLNLSTLKVTENGSDITSFFTKTNSGATATFPATNPLPQGAIQVVAQIQNLAGLQSTASTSFNIDTTPPSISVATPISNSYHGSATIPITVQYSDDQAIDTTKLSITLDGSPVTVAIAPTSATGTATGLVNGTHTLAAVIKDLAGNVGSTQITFYVDTSVPAIHVSLPAPNAIVNTPTPKVSIDYQDVVGVDLTTLKVFVNGTDATSLFTIGPTQATAQLTSSFAMPDGQNTITAQIANLAGILGNAGSTFLVDTTPPTIAIQAPPDRTNNSAPTVTVVYSDSGSGADPYSLVVTLDGTDVSSLVAPGANSATGVLQFVPPLADGTHQLSASIKDRAGNKSAPVTLSFVVDTKAPTISFTSPLDNSFINSPTPAITLQYNDTAGTGIVTSSVEIFLQQGSNPATDITSYFQLGPQQATGAIPSSIALNDGTYVLSATVSDLVGNSANARATFVVDTVAPTGTIQAPAANAILNANIVAVSLLYQDERSSVDTSKLLLTVDGVNQTSTLTLSPTQATGTLPALPDGVHTILLTVYDRSGNSSGVISQTFTTDTVLPSIAASVLPIPNSAGWNNTNVTVTFTCADSGSGVSTCPTPIAVATEGAGQAFCGQAIDAAGNASLAACATVNLDKTPPLISYAVSPPPNAGGIITSVPVTITFTCSDASSGVASCTKPIIVPTTGLSQVFSGTATDVAGNSATANVTLNIQTAAPTPPAIIAAVSPSPNSKGWNNSNPSVTFTCSPGSNPISICPASATVTAEGANQSICGTAVDTAGLSSTSCATVSLDKTAPTITALATPPPSASGWNTAPVTVTFTCADSLSGVAVCPPLQTIPSDGMHQVITGTAIDVAGNSSSAVQVILNIDQIPPTILQFTAPSQLAPGQSGTATVSATDNIGVVSVAFQLNGSTVATLSAPPYTTTFSVPTTANAGDTLTLTAVVSDAAGNANSSARGVQVVPSGVVTGQVLSDATGLPLVGATIQIVGGNGQDTSDNAGRYSIASNAPHLFLSISAAANAAAGTPQMMTVERELTLQSGVGTVPVDARLTAISSATSITAAGGLLTSGSLTVTVAPGAVSSATNFHLTTVSAQGLPGLLPLGWSPVAAFDLRADSTTAASFNAAFSQLPASAMLHLVKYDYNKHAWLMISPNLGAPNGSLTVPVPSVGDFALVVPDAGTNAPSIPSSGQPLPGVSMVALPAGAVATGSLNPPSVSPTGGTSIATLAVQSSVPLPSGSVIQANVLETYALASGKNLSDPKRTEDILLYQYAAPTGAAAVASFPVTPSQTFQPEQLSSGDVHLDILSGRESVRGQVGGSDAATVTGGDATLTIAAGSLPQDTAISVAPEPVDGSVPSTTTLIPLAEYNVDLSGQILNSPAQLSVAAGNAKPGDNIFLAQIQRLNGSPFLVVVSLGQVTGTTLVTQAAPGLSGITLGGDYVFYKLNSSTGYVSGIVTAATGPVAAMVQTNGLPFVTFASFSGSYVIPALAGSANLTASVLNTALAGTASAQVTAGQTTTANLVVIGQTESATITPANGSMGVSLTAEIDITAPDPFDQTSVTSTSVTLTQNGQGTATLVPIRFVFSQGGARLSVFPQSALQPSATYTLAASGTANLLGGLISIPTITFTTQAITAPNFNTDALVFGMPDQNGNTQISAPANSFPPGTTILIVDQTNGVVVSLTVANDGSVSGQMPATIDDVLAVTITTPDKTTASFTRSQFVAPDGTTAVGPGGGTVNGPGNTGLIVSHGTLQKGTLFQLSLLDQSAFPQLPTWPGLNFGSGIRVSAPAMPTFASEVKLAFPVPASAPKNAFYYVYRRLKDQNGNAYFETIDHAFVQGSGAAAQVVTASPPFAGYCNSYGNVNVTIAASGAAAFLPQFSPFQDFILMWDIAQTDPNLPGVASPGLIAGIVTQQVAATSTQAATTFQKDPSTVTITLVEDPSAVVTYTPQCGTFSIFDHIFGGGIRHLTATDSVSTVTTVTDEVNGIQADDATYGIYAGLHAQYRNIGRVNISFPPVTPPPPPSQLNIGVFTLDSNNHRIPISGVIQTGTPLTITLNSSLSVRGASINGAPYSTVVPDAPPANPLEGFTYSKLADPYTPAVPGVFTIVATAVDPLNPTGAPLTTTRSFLAIAQGGQIVPTNGQAPTVVGWIPDKNAQGVSPNTFPELTFSEPVKNVAGNITLVGTGSNDTPNVFLVGVKIDGTVASPVMPGDVITSLTIEPVSGLQFNDTYTLTAKKAILGSGVDQNNQPIPMAADFHLQFTTFGPQELGSGAGQHQITTRPAIIGQRAYVGEYLSSAVSGVAVFDISDPSKPTDLGAPATFIGRAQDATGLASSPATNGPLVAFAAGTAVDNPIPGNVWLFDVSIPNAPVRAGAVSVTNSATQAGIPLRLAMKDQYLYSSTFLQGLQVIDLQQAVTEYQQTDPATFARSVTTEGDGFAMDAIVNTIGLPLSTGGTATMFDLKADDFVLAGSSGTSPATQTLLVATGQLPFVVADPTQASISAVHYPPLDNAGNLLKSPLQLTSSDGTTVYQFCNGRAVALANISVTDGSGNSSTKHVAVLVGSGAIIAAGSPNCFAVPPPPGVPILMVVDMTQAYNPSGAYTPVPMGAMQLPTSPTDVAISGSVALIATGTNVLLVNIENPYQPASAGQITGTFGNWLTIDSSGLIAASTTTPRGGLQLSSLGASVWITGIEPAVIYVDKSGKVTQNFTVKYQAFDPNQQLTAGSATVVSEDQTAYQLPVTDFSPGEHQITVPTGTVLSVPPQDLVVTVQKPDGSFTDPVSLYIKGDFDPAVTALDTTSNTSNAGGSAASPASSILGLTPDVIPLNSASTQIQISGQGLTGLNLAYLRQSGGTWTQQTLTVTSDFQGSFTLPASLTSLAAVVEVSLSPTDASAAPLFVAAPSLPIPSATNQLAATIDRATVTAVGRPVLGLEGSSFPSDMKVGIGAQDSPALVLPIISRTDALITVDASSIPTSALGALTAYGVSSDNTQTTTGTAVGYFDERAFEVSNPSNSPNDADFFSTLSPLTNVNPKDSVADGDVSVVSVAGDLNAVQTASASDTFTLTLTGVNLTGGMAVHVASPRGDTPPVSAQLSLQNVSQVADSSFLSSYYIPPAQPPSPTSPNIVTTGTVSVPSNLKKTPLTQAKIAATTKTGQKVSASKKVDVERYFTAIPAGGRVQLLLYKDAKGNFFIHVPEIDRQSPLDATPIPGEQVRISVPGSAPLLRVTQENETPQGTPGPAGEKLFYLRGQHLTLNPPDAHGSISVRTMDPDDPSSNLRPYASVVMTVSGSLTLSSAGCVNSKTQACRNFDVGFESLGPSRNDVDRMIVDATDRVTPLASAPVPGQFLKSQFMQETSLGATNFRYEALTFDFAGLSGDLQPLSHETDVFHSYESAGNIVQIQRPAPGQFGPSQSLAGQPLKFQLPNGSIRLNAVQPFGTSDPYEPCVRSGQSTASCGVHVQVQEVYQNLKPVPQKRSVEFLPVRAQTVWRHSTGGNIQGVVPSGNRYSIDQATGIITLGRQLQTFTEPNPDPTDTKNPTVSTFELMTVTYSTFSSVPRQCSGAPCKDGGMLSSVLDLNQGVTSRQVRPASIKPQYTPRQSICAFYNTNMPRLGPALSFTKSENNLEFLPLGTQQYQVRDQRYCAATSQPYPASTYGMGQMSLQLWSSDSTFAKWFDATSTPITNLLDNKLASAELTVQAHLNAEGHGGCDASGNADAFQNCWSDAFRQYNYNGSGYASDPNVSTAGLAPIVWRGAQCFEPKQTYGNTYSTNPYCAKKNFTIIKKP